MASLGTLTLDLVAKVGSFIEPIQRAERQVEESAGRIEENLSSATDGIKEMALAAAGAFSAGALFSRFIEESKSAQAEQAQLAAVLKSTGESAGYSIDQLNDMADSLANVSSFGGGDINQAQTALLAFTGIVGKEFPRAMQAAVDMATRTGTSVVSAAETIGRALDVPSKGMSALSKQGFRFTEEQKKLAEQLEATGRTAEAQGIIFEAVEATYAGAGQAARNTFDGALFALDETIGGLLTSEKGISGLTTAVNGLNDALSSDITKTALEGIVVSAGLLAAVLAGRLTSATVTSTAAGYAKVQQIIAENSSTQLANEIAAQRTSRILHLTQVELANAQAQAARLSGIQRLAFIESTLIPLQNAETAAITANTAAQNANNTSKGLAARAGAGLLALTGGPLGLAVAIASVGAAMYFMRDSTNEASESLSLVGKSAAEARIEFEKLNKVQQAATMAKLRDDIRETEKEVDSKLNDITNAFGTFQLTMSKSDASVGAFSKFNNELRIAAKNGQDLTPILNVMQKKLGVPQEVIDSVLQANGAYGQSTTKLNDLKETQKLLNISQGNVANSANQAANAITGVGNAANKATEALQKYLGQQQSSAWKTQFAATYSEKHSLPTGFGNMVAEAQQANDGKGLTQQQTNDLWKYYQAQQAVTKLDKQRSDASALAAKNSSERNKADDKAVSDKANKAKQIQDTYDGLVYSMGEQNALIGKTGDTSKLVYRMMYGDLKDLSQAQKENLELTSKSLESRQKQFEFDGEKKSLIEQLAVARTLNEENRKTLELRQKYSSFNKDDRNELIIYSRRLSSINQFNEVLESTKTNEQQAFEATQKNLDAINYGLKNVTMSEVEYQNALKARQQIIGASTLPSYTPELSGATAIGAGGTLSGGQGKMFEAIGAGVDLDKSYLDQKAKLAEQYAEKEGLEAEHQERLLLLNADYAAKRNLVELGVKEADKQIMLERLSTAEATFGGLADLAKVFAGEQSGVFKAMFAAQKAMQIATALINIPSAASKAYDSMIGVPFVGPVLAVGAAGAAVAAQLVQVAKIRSTNLQGMAHDGIDSVPKTGTWLLEEGERVMTSKTSAKLDRTLEKVKDGPAKQGINLNIQNFGTSKQFEVQQLSANDVRIICRDEAPKAVAADMQHPNSVTSKSLKSNFDVGQRR